MTNPTNAAAEIEQRIAVLCERARKARMRKRESEYPPLSEVQPALEALVAAYRSADDAERERMRSVCRGKVDAQTWLLWIAGEWAREHAQSKDHGDFENSLAALSLEDRGLAADDTLLVLGVVWHRAHRAGFDLRPALDRAAKLSSQGEGSLAALLRGWERSTFMKDEVAPHLDVERLPYETDE